MHTYDVTVNLYLQNEWPCRLLICFRSLMICDLASRWCQTMDLQHRKKDFFFYALQKLSMQPEICSLLLQQCKQGELENTQYNKANKSYSWT